MARQAKVNAADGALALGGREIEEIAVRTAASSGPEATGGGVVG
ncbi:MAG TPA: hypothetical protein VG474_08395 [Solirubrobacteraceae bacterium]|nr:hypothetical protein [Solirubrobacteraceae bacterium]